MIDEIGTLGWEAKIRFFGPLSEKSIKEIDDLSFDIETNESDIVLKGFVVKTPPMSADDAFLYAQEIANRVFDYLSAIHGYHITGYLSNITEIKPKGEKKTGIAQSKFHSIKRKPMELDFSEIEPILKKKDIILIRQLAHYRMGLEARYLVTKIQQFYQVAEDEYDEKNQFIKDNKWVRNIVSHKELTQNKSSIEKAEDVFGKNYLDLSNPKDIERLKEALGPIQTEAEKIITSKLKI